MTLQEAADRLLTLDRGRRRNALSVAEIEEMGIVGAWVDLWGSHGAGKFDVGGKCEVRKIV